jgi:hypothetical protein
LCANCTDDHNSFHHEYINDKDVQQVDINLTQNVQEELLAIAGVPILKLKITELRTSVVLCTQSILIHGMIVAKICASLILVDFGMVAKELTGNRPTS